MLANALETKPLLITSGEPSGIGLDIVLKLHAEGLLGQLSRPIVVLADIEALKSRAQLLNLQVDINVIETLVDDGTLFISNALSVIHIACKQPIQAGKLNIHNAAHVVTQLNLAADLAMQNKVAAIVTAPVQKSIINDAIKQKLVGLNQLDGKLDNYFSGHTEFFQQKASCQDVVMMLANEKLKVALVTTHLPLKDVPAAVTTNKLTTVIDILLADMQQKFGLTQPKILVCGLNPHAGEGGHLGVEEIQTINPVLKSYQGKGVDISLALPADTLFNPVNLASTDCFLAMYHDQGLTVLKALGFGGTVNITLGLPFIRTSVDHGTALDMAGTGKASATSLWAAIKLAEKLAVQQQNNIF